MEVKTTLYWHVKASNLGSLIGLRNIHSDRRISVYSDSAFNLVVKQTRLDNMTVVIISLNCMYVAAMNSLWVGRIVHPKK